MQVTRGWRDVLVLPVLLAVLVAASCDGQDAGDSTSPTSPTSVTSTSEPTGTSATSSSTRRPTTTKEDWDWGLPGGDPSPAGEDTDDVAVYRALKEGCSRGQAELDSRWFALRTPLAVLVFQAAVHACSGDRTAARRVLQRAQGDLSGLQSSAHVCTAYKALRSVLDQVSPDSVSCPGGPMRRWPPGPDPSAPRDDPRTDGDESAATTTSTRTPTTPRPNTTQPTTTTSRG